MTGELHIGKGGFDPVVAASAEIDQTLFGLNDGLFEYDLGSQTGVFAVEHGDPDTITVWVGLNTVMPEDQELLIHEIDGRTVVYKQAEAMPELH